MQDLFTDQPQVIPLEHGHLIYYSAFLSPGETDQLFGVLQGTVAWQQSVIRVGGVEGVSPA